MYVLPKQEQETGIFLLFFSSHTPRERPQGDNIHSIASSLLGINQSRSFFLSFSLFLRGRRAPESALMKERTPPLQWFFRRAHVSGERERDKERQRRENEFSVTRSLSRYRLSLPLSPSTFSPEEEREHKKKQTNS